MKKLFKSIVCVFLCVIMLTLAACAQTSEPANSSSEPEAEAIAPTEPEATEAETEAGFHTVTDALEKEITVPDEIESVAIISTLPLASVYCMVGGDASKIAALTPASKNAAVKSFLIKAAPELQNASTAFAEGDSLNVEELISINPSVVFYNIDDAAAVDAVSKLEELEIPCVGVNTRISSTIETFSNWAALVSRVLGTENKAKEIISYGEETEKLVAERVAEIPEAERKSAIILSNYNANAIQVAGSTFGRYWLSTIGAKNPSEEIEEKIAPISLEQLYEWDPDVIFLNSFSAFTAEQVMNNEAVEGQDWSGLKAVKNGDFYKMPLGVYYWFPPCSDSPLALLWLAKHLYPEKFEDIDMDATITDYYSRFYGLELTREDLETLYNPPAESAMKS